MMMPLTPPSGCKPTHPQKVKPTKPAVRHVEGKNTRHRHANKFVLHSVIPTVHKKNFGHATAGVTPAHLTPTIDESPRVNV